MQEIAGRLHDPWPALRNWANSIDLEGLDDASHAHVPFGELELQALFLRIQH